MTKADLVEKIKGTLGFQVKDSVELVESVLEIMKSTLEAGDNIKIAAFGRFEVKKKADRKGRNPQTGEPIMVSRRRVVTFKPSQVLKGSINS